MNQSALIVMLVTLTSVTLITLYFFIRVLFTPPVQEPDSFIENDDEETRKNSGREG